VKGNRGSTRSQKGAEKKEGSRSYKSPKKNSPESGHGHTEGELRGGTKGYERGGGSGSIRKPGSTEKKKEARPRTFKKKGGAVETVLSKKERKNGGFLKEGESGADSRLGH